MLSMLGIAIGIGSVILLTSIGEGTRLYILDQFTQFGTNLLQINPGKAETMGVPGVLGGTTHKLTIDDALAIERLPQIETVMPLAFGIAVPEVWKFRVRQGSFWPAGDPRRGQSMAVLGPKLKRELFDNRNALGRFVRIGGTRFRVVGVMEPKGRLLGFDIDDGVYIPVASAMRLFNQDELQEIDVVFSSSASVDRIVDRITRVLIDRHRGNEDFTIITQDASLEVFGNVMNIITLAVAAIAAISLLVGAIGILTMMWIAVGERTAEIGLIRAVGASRRQVQMVFLTEAGALATVGGLLGLLGGLGICALLRGFVPGLPVHTPVLYAILAIGISFATGLLSGVAPARRAASLDPIEALHTE
jgi:putative ABC transport system permease protein